MKKLPRFTKNMPWGRVSLLQMQNLVDEVSKLRNMVAGPGLQMSNTSDGIMFSLDTSVIPDAKKGEFSTVVLIEEPNEESTSLKVMEVKFRVSPAEDESPYVFAPTGVIEAVPDFGSEILDYKSFFWNITEDPDPTSDTTFLRLQRNYKQRNVLWFPSGGDTRFAVVRSVDDESLTDFSVMAQAVRWDGTEWEFKGEATEIATYPGVHKRYYEPLIFQGNEVSLPNTNILRIFSADGEIWLEQTMRWAIRKSPGNVATSDCTPVERITDA